MTQYAGPIQSLVSEYLPAVHTIAWDNRMRDCPQAQLAFDEAEAAYETRPQIEPPCPHRFTDFDALECWSGNCYQAGWELLQAIRHTHQI